MTHMWLNDDGWVLCSAVHLWLCCWRRSDHQRLRCSLNMSTTWWRHIGHRRWWMYLNSNIVFSITGASDTWRSRTRCGELDHGRIVHWYYWLLLIDNSWRRTRKRLLSIANDFRRLIAWCRRVLSLFRRTRTWWHYCIIIIYIQRLLMPVWSCCPRRFYARIRYFRYNWYMRPLIERAVRDDRFKFR
jgi:hypothetical protein